MREPDQQEFFQTVQLEEVEEDWIEQINRKLEELANEQLRETSGDQCKRQGREEE